MGYWTLRVRGKGLQGLVGNTHDAPLGEHVGADAFVEGDGWGIPGEDVPLEAGAAFGDSDLGEVLKQGPADSLPSLGGRDVDVLEAQAVVAAPGAVAGEEEREAGGSLILLGEDASEAGCGAEAVAEQVGFRGENGIRFALV